uniref:Uncharacterized protein n=1 Tax=Rhizophora mucronata TaxID=61149 RepID=A0A2P2P8S2_RHIMU
MFWVMCRVIHWILVTVKLNTLISMVLHFCPLIGLVKIEHIQSCRLLSSFL